MLTLGCLERLGIYCFFLMKMPAFGISLQFCSPLVGGAKRIYIGKCLKLALKVYFCINKNLTDETHKWILENWLLKNLIFYSSGIISKWNWLEKRSFLCENWDNTLLRESFNTSTNECYIQVQVQPFKDVPVFLTSCFDIIYFPLL